MAIGGKAIVRLALLKRSQVQMALLWSSMARLVSIDMDSLRNKTMTNWWAGIVLWHLNRSKFFQIYRSPAHLICPKEMHAERLGDYK